MPCRRCGQPGTQLCPTCRGTTAERGYGASHVAARKANEALMIERGYLDCTRCGEPIGQGEPWAQDHTADRAGYLGPSHKLCNERAAGIASARRND